MSTAQRSPTSSTARVTPQYCPYQGATPSDARSERRTEDVAQKDGRGEPTPLTGHLVDAPAPK
jgi:hypothetical protein